MKKRELFLGGLLLFTMAFGTVTLTACGDDDKENEIVTDPLESEKEYYIVGTVTTANGVLAGAKVDAGNSLTATTDAQGTYQLTVKETGEYTLNFTADKMENFETKVTIASSAANRTQATLNVKMAKAIDMSAGKTTEVKENEDTKVEIPNQETNETEAEINIPSGSAEAGTTVTAVGYEEAQGAQSEDTSTGTQTITASMSNIAVQTSPEDATAKADIEISIPNAANADNYFDTDFMEALKDNAATKAATKFGEVAFKNNSYVITIPQGEKIAGKYAAKVKYGKKADNVKAGEYNKVNNQNSVVRIENRDYSALDVTLAVETTCGWKYTTSPTEALSAVGASNNLAASIQKYIENNEGKEGTYSISKELKASISGNHVLFFGSKAKTQTKTYTFNIIVKGEKKQVTVKLMCYVGYTEEYTNGPLSQHSGGTTGGAN